MSLGLTTYGSIHTHHGMIVVNRIGADGHDDGLVHAHGWASAGEAQARDSVAGMMVFNRVGEDGHDDGLVHAHEWAAAK